MKRMSHTGRTKMLPCLLANGIILLVMMLSASNASAGGAGRSGFTAETGIGVGLTRLTQDTVPYWTRSDGLSRWGWGGLAIGLGGFVDEGTAVMVRLSGTAFETRRINEVHADSSGTRYINQEPQVFANTFLGIVVQRWVTPRLAFGGGIGLGAYGTSSYANRGIAADVRSSFAIIRRTGWGLHVSVECIPAHYADGTVVSFAALSELQWY